MAFPKSLQNVALWMGIGVSLFWSTFLSSIPALQKLELKAQDFLSGLVPPPAPPPEILLVKIRDRDLKAPLWLENPAAYAHLVDRILKGGAAVAILNLRSNWVQAADHADHPIKELVGKYPDRLVLVLPTTSASQHNPTEWRHFHYFVPRGAGGQSIFPIDTVLGFSEYEPEAHNPSSLGSPSRQANLVGSFIFTNNFGKLETLDSAVWLGIKKYYRQQEPPKSILDPGDEAPLQVHFWPERTPFASLNVRAIADNNAAIPKSVRNKIVLVGFADHEDPNSFSVHSSYGTAISNVEFQANVLGNLLTQSYYRLAPRWLSIAIAIGGGVVISEIIVGMMLQQARSQKQRWHELAMSMGGGLFFLGFMSFWQRLIFPFVFYTITWGATGFSVVFCMWLGIRENLIQQQEGEIARLRAIEQEAIVSQAKKLINRISANIHDGPLQELKLIMDSLEILQLDCPNLNINPVLEQLESMGNHLRQHLYHARNPYLQITPELREGLVAGIEKKLRELVTSEQLRLKVETQLQTISEPKFNSLWLSAREGIFSFFCEAIANAIQHAQPPNGNATQLEVHLSKQGDRCTLTVENDGFPSSESVQDTHHNTRKRGGYGTTLMKNIARELPGGSFRKIALEGGGFQTSLTWDLAF